jgi:hypothetical protein
VMSDGLRAVLFFRNNSEALLAQGVLAHGGLPAQLIPSPHGCGYAIRTEVADLEAAIRLLLMRRIPVTRVELSS